MMLRTHQARCAISAGRRGPLYIPGSEPAVGTSPRSHRGPQSEEHRPPRDGSEHLTEEGYNVLLIEDNPDDALLIVEMLDREPASCRVDHAVSLDDGMARLSTCAHDIVLLDVSLPDGQGIGTIMRSVERCGNTPIVVITGTDDTELASRALLAGAQDYLVKDEVDGRTLMRTIRHAIERQQLLGDVRAAQQQAHHLATHDRLTGLPNRELLFDRLEQSIHRAQRSKERLSVLFVDVDRFKTFNDQFGHAAGDEILSQIASRLRGAVRKSDTVARLGGDEFTIVLPGTGDAPDPGRAAASILSSMRKPFNVLGKQLHASVSIGISTYPDDGQDAGMLVRRADLAMYTAKSIGGETYRFYSTRIEVRAAERLALEASMKGALRRDEFYLEYQPQVDAGSERTFGAEALLRWNHPSLGRIAPSRFVPLAERNGLIVPIGDWVLREACAQARRWNATRPGAPLRVAVNLSSKQLLSGSLAARVRQILSDCELRPSELELEITESSLIEDTDEAIAALVRLKRLGVKISLDDFGIGYSSLDLLRRLPADGLKIDQSFIRRVLTDRKDAQITDAIIAMARSLNLRIVAEGVETVEEKEFLMERNCPYMQGFYFGEPLSGTDFERSMLSSKRSR